MHDVVESERLLLRHYEPSDLEALFAIHSDARVGTYTFSPATRAQAAERYEAAEAQCARCGAAPWVVRLRGDGGVIGYGGLLLDPFAPGWGIEIAYFIAPSHWGQGFATEIARSAIAHGFETLALDELAAFTRPDNAASRKVLEKVGFELCGYVPSLERNRYAIRREAAGREGREGREG